MSYRQQGKYLRMKSVLESDLRKVYVRYSDVGFSQYLGGSICLFLWLLVRLKSLTSDHFNTQNYSVVGVSVIDGCHL